ncbi:hypothetical protein NQD34_017427 [Periophthalmus magnuspinnatus]|nr:hypothetical protein NQD34_017427 [Periophthalmus magnuspinnatus]
MSLSVSWSSGGHTVDDQTYIRQTRSLCLSVDTLSHCGHFVSLWTLCLTVDSLSRTFVHCGLFVPWTFVSDFCPVTFVSGLCLLALSLACLWTLCLTVDSLSHCGLFVSLWTLCLTVDSLSHCGHFVSLWTLCLTVDTLSHCGHFVSLWTLCLTVDTLSHCLMDQSGNWKNFERLCRTRKTRHKEQNMKL